MTIGSNQLVGTFTTDGVTQSWTFANIQAQFASDILVYLNGVLQASGFTVTVTSNSDGSTGFGVTVASISVPAAGQQGAVVRNVALLQTLSLPVEGAYSEIAIANALDRLTMMAQQISAQVNLALTIPPQYTGIVNPVIPGVPVGGNLLSWNANGTGFAWVTPAQAFALATPIPGGGTVVGPGSAGVNQIVAFSSSANVIQSIGAYPTTPGLILINNGPTFVPTWGALTFPNYGLKAASITGAYARGFPTQQGAGPVLSGTYTLFGNWIQTGNINMQSGTRIYINGNMTFVQPFNINVTPGSPGGQSFSFIAGSQAQNGSGIGGGMAGSGITNNGGAGGGAPQNTVAFGGNGGSGTANLISLGGSCNWVWQDQFAGSGGGGGAASSGTGVGGVGGAGGGAVYIEVNGNIIFNNNNVSNWNAVSANAQAGGNGTGAGANTGSGAGGGGGGIIVIRCSGSMQIQGSGTWGTPTGMPLIVNGGNGGNGSGGTTLGGAGGGGAAGCIDVVCGGTIAAGLLNAGNFSAFGGTQGTGNVTQAATAGAGIGWTPVQNSSFVVSVL